MEDNTLRIGEISFTNCNNIFYYLRNRFPLPGTEYVQGTPAALNRLLREGGLDVSISSSIEYAFAPEQYVVLPGYCIGSSLGSVPSIRLFSRLPLEKLDQAKVILTTQSATTVILCRIILRRFLGFENEFIDLDCGLEEGLWEAGAVLLIGDRALAANCRPDLAHSYDLSTIWREHTGLPFVFALWLLRVEAAETKPGLVEAFRQALVRAHVRLDAPDEELIREVLARKTFFSREELLDYWTHIGYELTPDHIRGLELFYRLAGEMDLLETVPKIRFYDPQKIFLKNGLLLPPAESRP